SAAQRSPKGGSRIIRTPAWTAVGGGGEAGSSRDIAPVITFFARRSGWIAKAQRRRAKPNKLRFLNWEIPSRTPEIRS
ncbi:MAG: hypothetical protein MUE97_07460, partial [Phycisphaerales bacterium]|nr:hypothetical protein [Phycisphaerales bacterium]